MTATYRASLNLDFTDQHVDTYQLLLRALIETGWQYVETSALVLDTDDLGRVWRGIELVSRACAAAGRLSALTFHIQASEDFRGIPYKGARSRRNAVGDILAYPLPGPRP